MERAGERRPDLWVDEWTFCWKVMIEYSLCGWACSIKDRGRSVILGSENSQEIKLRQFEDDRLANLNYMRSTDITFLQGGKEREKSICIKCIHWAWEASCKEENVLWACVLVAWYWKTERVKELWTAGEWQSCARRMKCGGGEKV